MPPDVPPTRRAHALRADDLRRASAGEDRKGDWIGRSRLEQFNERRKLLKWGASELQHPWSKSQECRRQERQEKPQDPAHGGGRCADAVLASRRRRLRVTVRRAGREIRSGRPLGPGRCGSGLRRDGGLDGLRASEVSSHDRESSPFPPDDVRKACAKDSYNGHRYYNKYEMITAFIRNTNSRQKLSFTPSIYRGWWHDGWQTDHGGWQTPERGTTLETWETALRRKRRSVTPGADTSRCYRLTATGHDV